MGYRDDVDTLYTRAVILQRELDAAKESLAEREEELARMRGGAPKRAETSPGMRELRAFPDPQALLERLVTIPEHDDKRPRLPGLPPLRPLPMPNWGALAARTDEALLLPPAPLHERVREAVVLLAHEDLVLIAKLVEELTDGRDGMDEKLRARLRWLASEIALAEKAT